MQWGKCTVGSFVSALFAVCDQIYFTRHPINLSTLYKVHHLHGIKHIQRTRLNDTRGVLINHLLLPSLSNFYYQLWDKIGCFYYMQIKFSVFTSQFSTPG